MRGDDAESLLDAETEGTLEALGLPTTQGPQTTGQRAAGQAALALESLACGHGSLLVTNMAPFIPFRVILVIE